MSVFPYPTDTGVPPIEVPNISKFTYGAPEPRAFTKFPYRCGFLSPSDPRNLDLNRPAEEIASFLQSWLFFGLIAEMTGSHIDPTNLSRAQQRSQIEPIEPLERLINIGVDPWLDTMFRERYKYLKSLDLDRQNAIYLDLKRTLVATRQHITFVDVRHKQHSDRLDLVILSVRMLLAYFHQQLQDNWSREEQKKAHPSRIYNSSRSLQFLIMRMLENGWCKKRIRVAYKKFSWPTLYYLSSLGRRMPRHVTHLKCNWNECNITRNETDMNQPIHRQDSCACTAIASPMEDVKRLIHAGKIPLFRVQFTSQGKMELDVVPCTSAASYTAISHVWSDGHFGSNSNSLPQCQLEHLDSLLRGMPPSSYKFMRGLQTLHNNISNMLPRRFHRGHLSNSERLFWLDTLCIPQTGDKKSENESRRNQEDDENDKLRTKAINMMNLIYSSAARVLVLDAELQQIRGGKQSIWVFGDGTFTKASSLQYIDAPHRDRLTEIAGHVFGSNWMGRAWTLQEGSLAQECAVQFVDSTIMLKHIDPEIYRLSDELSEDKDFRKLVYFFPLTKSMRKFRYQQLKGSCDLGFDQNPAYRLLPFMQASSSCILHLISYIGIITSPVVDLRPPNYTWNFTGIRYLRDLHSTLRESLKFQEDFLQHWTLVTEETFKKSWNSLTERSTTQKDDMHTIIANLSGFDTSYLLRTKEAGDRMRSILFSLNYLPLDILFMDVEKYGRGSDHLDRWIPLMPAGHELHGTTRMVFGQDGLILKTGYTSSEVVFLLNTSNKRTKRFRIPGVLSVSPESDAEDTADDAGYWIEALSPCNDEIVDDGQEETCIILECVNQKSVAKPSQDTPIRGARLLVTKHDGNNVYLRYDCAVTAVQTSDPPPSWIGQGQDSEIFERPTIWLEYSARRLPLDKTLVLLVSDGHRNLLSQRPKNPFLTSESGIQKRALFCAVAVFIIACTVLGVVRTRLFYNDKLGGLEDTPLSSAITALIVLLLIFTFPLQYAIFKYLFQVIDYPKWVATFKGDDVQLRREAKTI